MVRRQVHGYDKLWPLHFQQKIVQQPFSNSLKETHHLFAALRAIHNVAQCKHQDGKVHLR